MRNTFDGTGGIVDEQPKRVSAAGAVLKGSVLWFVWLATFTVEALILIAALALLTVGATFDSVNSSPVLTVTLVGLGAVIVALSGVACGWTGGLIARRFGIVRAAWWAPSAVASVFWLAALTVYYPPGSMPGVMVPGAARWINIATLGVVMLVPMMVAQRRAILASGPALRPRATP